MQNYIVAIVVPDFAVIRKWMTATQQPLGQTQADAENGGELSVEQICSSQAVSDLIMKDLTQLKVHNKFNGLELPKKIFLHFEEFTVENDLITPTQKLKRPVLTRTFAE